MLGERGAHALVVDRRVGVEPVRTRDRPSASAPWRYAGRLTSSWRLGMSPATRSNSVSFNWNRSAYCRRSSAGFASSSFVGQLSTTVRSRSAEAKSSAVCVARSMAGVSLPPGLECFLHVGAKRLVLDEPPRFVHDAQLQRAYGRAVGDAAADTVQDVEQQRLEQRGIGAHGLEVEHLKWLDVECVLRRGRRAPRSVLPRPISRAGLRARAGADSPA